MPVITAISGLNIRFQLSSDSLSDGSESFLEDRALLVDRYTPAEHPKVVLITRLRVFFEGGG